MSPPLAGHDDAQSYANLGLRATATKCPVWVAKLVCRPRRGALPCRDRSIWGVEILYTSFALSKDANGEPPIRALLWPDVRFGVKQLASALIRLAVFFDQTAAAFFFLRQPSNIDRHNTISKAVPRAGLSPPLLRA
jgi:hypothetical protein